MASKTKRKSGFHHHDATVIFKLENDFKLLFGCSLSVDKRRRRQRRKGNVPGLYLALSRELTRNPCAANSQVRTYGGPLNLRGFCTPVCTPVGLAFPARLVCAHKYKLHDSVIEVGSRNLMKSLRVLARLCQVKQLEKFSLFHQFMEKFAQVRLLWHLLEDQIRLGVCRKHPLLWTVWVWISPFRAWR